MRRKGNITLVPAGGLGNRMKSIAAALRLAKLCGSSLHVYWFRDWALGCSFHQLFQPIAEDCLKLSEATSLNLLTVDRPRKRNFFLPQVWQSIAFQARMDEKATTKGMREAFDFASWAKDRNVWMASNVYFLSEEMPQDAFDIFVPVSSLQRRIEEVSRQWDDNVVGVHIRRTDNARSIQNSPTEAFMERMKAEPAETRFYVATDDEEVKLLLHNEFGDRITTLPRQAERGSRQGMEDAVVEMYLLSRCRKILGSSCSTYSMTAASLGRIPLETVTKYNR